MAADEARELWDGQILCGSAGLSKVFAFYLVKWEVMGVEI